MPNRATLLFNNIAHVPNTDFPISLYNPSKSVNIVVIAMQTI